MKTKYLYIVVITILTLSSSGFDGTFNRRRPEPNGGSAFDFRTADNTSGLGSVTGTVKLSGPRPQPQRIVMTQDPVCSKLHPSGATNEEVVAGTNGALANVVVYVAEGLGDGSPGPAKGPAVIDQKGCLYNPRVLALQVNQKLQVFNRDATTHNIHPMPKNNREWNKSQPPGSAPLEQTFAREEIAIPVKCNVHPWMKGYIHVFKHPYFGITGKDGRFAIRNLPPGSYTLTAWHEKFGTTTQKVTIAGNETKTMDFVFKAQPGQSPAGLSPRPGL